MKHSGLVIGAALGLSCLTTTSLAISGTKLTQQVTVGSNYAYGTIGGARASSDIYQYIGCSSYGTYGVCLASDASSNTVSCVWTTSAQSAALSSVTPNSQLYFSFDGSGNCTLVKSTIISYYQPMVP